MSTLTFGSDEHAAAVALLSLTVFFGLVSGAQGALIQGMRRIRSCQDGSVGHVVRYDHQHPGGVFPAGKGSGAGPHRCCRDDYSSHGGTAGRYRFSLLQ